MAAKDVLVVTIRRAECQLPDCGWKGGEHARHEDANYERLGHLNWHALSEQEATADAV